MNQIDDLPSKPGHLIRLAHQKAIAVFSTATQEFNITAVQHVIMVALNKFPDIDLSNLAQIVGLDRSTTGNVAARLSGRGLVLIRTSKVDRRAKSIRLTEEGERLLDAMLDGVRLSQEMLLGPLTASERVDFFRILQKLTGKAYPRHEADAHPTDVAETEDRDKHLKQSEPLARAHIDRTDEWIATALWGYVSDVPSNAAIFPRWVDPGPDAFPRILESFAGIREEVLHMASEEARDRFVFVLAFGDLGVSDDPIALGLKQAWIGLVRKLMSEVKAPNVSFLALTWAPPVRQRHKTFDTPSSLSRKTLSGLGELTRYFLFETVEMPGFTIMDNVVGQLSVPMHEQSLV